MVPQQLLARVDGLPVTLVKPKRIWPVPDRERNNGREVLSRYERTRVERRIAGVHQCRIPAWAKALIAEHAAEEERFEIRADLNQAGLL